MAASAAAGLERGTLLQYRQHLDLHIAPFIGRVKLSQLNAPEVRRFEDRLRQEGRSPSMVKKVRATLGTILADAGEQGLTGRNAVRDLRSRRKKGGEKQAEKRRKANLKAGVDFPLPNEVTAILGHAKGRWRPLLATAIFTGLRASELRGLRWEDVDFDTRKIHVRQRADRYNEFGPPKSEAGERDVDAGPMVLNTLREWRLQCPRRDGKLDLVFPNGQGKVESLANISKRGLAATQVAAGVTVEKLGKDGKPVVKAKYPGMHKLRHFFASWCLNTPERGGLGMTPQEVQAQLGHSSIVLTMDVYGHLFPRGDNTERLAKAEAALWG